MKNTRKKNLVFAVILMLVMSLFVITVNAEEIEISYDNDMDSIIVKTDDDSRGSAFAAYAEYDDDGVLIALKTQEIPFVSGKAMMSVEVCSLNNKVFVWDDMNIAQAPIGDVYSINNTSQETGTETENPIAIYLEQYMCMSNGEECFEIEAYANGKKVNLLIEEESQAEDFVYNRGFEYKGVPFTYTLSEEGFVDEIFPIFSEDYWFELPTFNELLDVSFDAANGDAKGSFDALLNPEIDILFDDEEAGDNTEFYFGPVMDKTPQTIALAQMNKGENLTNIDSLRDFTFAENLNVYKYDYTNMKHIVSKTHKGDIVKTFIPKIAYADEDKTIVDWTVEESKDAMVFAILKEVNRAIVDVYFFVYPDYEISSTDIVTLPTVEFEKSEVDLDMTAKWRYQNIYFYKNEKMKGCKLSQIVEFSVNGVTLKYIDELEDLLADNKGKVYLYDLNADGLYDKVDIEYIGTAIVDSVIDDRIYFDNYTSDMSSTLSTTQDAEYKVILDGEEISLEDIEAGDVLSIAYDYNDSFRNSSFYYIEVSRDTVLGEVTKYNNKYVTVNDTVYEINSYLLNSWYGRFGKYLLKLDSDGLIAGYSEIVEASNYGILDNMFENYLGEHYVVIVDSNGDSHEYEIKKQSDVYEIENILYEDAFSKIKREYQYRVVEYRVDQAGKIVIKENIQPKQYIGCYNSYKSKIGTVIIDETSKLLDMEMYKLEHEIYPLEPTALKDGAEYSIYSYAQNSEGAYVFILIENGEGIYGKNQENIETYTFLVDVYEKLGTYYALVLDFDGTHRRYTLTNQTEAEALKIRDLIYDGNNKRSVQERTYNCTIESNKYITIGDKKLSEENISATYDDSTNTFAGIALNDEILILNYIEAADLYGNYDEIIEIDETELDSESKYTTYAFKNDSDEYDIILITDVISAEEDQKARLGVYSSYGTTIDDVIGETISIKAYTEGEEEYLVLDTLCEMPDITEGTPFMYTKNADGYVAEIIPVFEESVYTSIPKYTNFRKCLFEIANINPYGSFDSVINPQLQTMFDTEKEDVEFYFGPIVDKNSEFIMLAELDRGENLTNIENAQEHWYTGNTNAYIYDYAASHGQKVGVGTRTSVLKTPIAKPAYEDVDKTIINWAHETLADTVNFALVKEVEGDVTEIIAYHAAY